MVTAGAAVLTTCSTHVVGRRSGTIEHEHDIERFVDSSLAGDVRCRRKCGKADKRGVFVAIDRECTLATTACQFNTSVVYRLVSPDSAGVLGGVTTLRSNTGPIRIAIPRIMRIRINFGLFFICEGEIVDPGVR